MSSSVLLVENRSVVSQRKPWNVVQCLWNKWCFCNKTDTCSVLSPTSWPIAVSGFQLLTWWAFWKSGAKFLQGLVPLLFSHPSWMWSHPKACNCFLQPAQSTVLLLSDLSISSEYSPGARQTCRVCYQDSLSSNLASPAQVPIHATERLSLHSLLFFCGGSAHLPQITSVLYLYHDHDKPDL